MLGVAVVELPLLLPSAVGGDADCRLPHGSHATRGRAETVSLLIGGNETGLFGYVGGTGRTSSSGTAAPGRFIAAGRFRTDAAGRLATFAPCFWV